MDLRGRNRFVENFVWSQCRFIDKYVDDGQLVTLGEENLINREVFYDEKGVLKNGYLKLLIIVIKKMSFVYCIIHGEIFSFFQIKC